MRFGALPLLRLVLPQTPITLSRPGWMPNWTQVAPNIPTESIPASMIETVVSGPVAPQVNWQLPLIAVWLSVAALWFARQLWRQHQYMKAVQENSSAASEHIRGKLNEARKSLNMKTVPTLRLSNTNVGPLVSGILRPVIVLPQNFETDFTPRQQFFALTHELAHIKRGDLWAALGALVFRALNWLNPLVHFCAAKFRADQESACDAYVLNIIGGGAQTKQSYAATLIHSAKLTRISARTPTEQAPLCLTIYHPLKERLMTMKTSKTNTSILSRIGVGVFLAAALAATAPISFAGDPEAKTKTKKVMKWVENDNGVETTKHIEVTVEDGVTTAYSIDEHGNKTVIDASEIEMMPGGGQNHMSMFTADGESGEKHMKIMMDGEGLLNMEDGAHSKLIIKRMTKNADGTTTEMDNNVMVFAGGVEGSHTAAMVSAAEKLLSQADSKDLSSRARRKLEKAQRAVKEAQEALAAEE